MTVRRISVCILAGHGAAALDACLMSLRGQIAPPLFELLVGGSPSKEAVAVVRAHFPDAQICDTGRRLPGAARNPLIDRAQGDLLLFLDDDVTVPPDLLRRLADLAARHPEATVFGGPNETPPGSSRFQIIQGAVLSSLMGAGPVGRRYGARHAGAADERWFTLCNLAVRRRAMLPFVSHLVCAEENALLAELRRRGARMRYEPGLRVFHARRPSRRSFAQQMFKYGRGRGQLMARRPQTVRAAYLAPSAWLLYLLALPVLLTAGVWPALVLAPAILYAFLLGISAGWIGFTLRRIAAVPLAFALLATIHFSYGAGVIRGLLSRGRTAEEESPQWASSAHPAPVHER